MKEALQTRAFWFIAIAHIASAVPIVTLSIHLVPKLTDIGLSLSMAGVVVATYTIVALPFQFPLGLPGRQISEAAAHLLFPHAAGNCAAGNRSNKQHRRSISLRRTVRRGLRRADAAALFYSGGILRA